MCACVCAPPSWEYRLLTFFWSWNLHILCSHYRVCNIEGGYFIFDDISVRQEGHFRFKFSLFRIVEWVILISSLVQWVMTSRLSKHNHRSQVFYLCSILSDTFQVYSPKSKLSDCSIGKCKVTNAMLCLKLFQACQVHMNIQKTSSCLSWETYQVSS